MLKKVNNILLITIIACFCVLTWASVFVWHNAVLAIIFFIFVIIALKGYYDDNKN